MSGRPTVHAGDPRRHDLTACGLWAATLRVAATPGDSDIDCGGCRRTRAYRDARNARRNDHRPDVYDLIEIAWPREYVLDELPDVPASVRAPGYAPCQDCRANLFLRFDVLTWRWVGTVAHDDGCPTLAAAMAGAVAQVAARAEPDPENPGADKGADDAGDVHVADEQRGVDAEDERGHDDR